MTTEHAPPRPYLSLFLSALIARVFTILSIFILFFSQTITTCIQTIHLSKFKLFTKYFFDGSLFLSITTFRLYFFFKLHHKYDYRSVVSLIVVYFSNFLVFLWNSQCGNETEMYTTVMGHDIPYHTFLPFENVIGKLQCSNEVKYDV